MSAYLVRPVLDYAFACTVKATPKPHYLFLVRLIFPKDMLRIGAKTFVL